VFPSDPPSTWLTDETKTFSSLPNRYSTVDRPPDQCPHPHDSGRKYMYRKRFSFKTRSRLKEHEPPDAMKKYQWKPWKKAPDCPLDRTTYVPQNKNKTKPTKPPPPAKDMDKAALLNAMQWEHPTRTLNIGTINANVTRGLNKEFGQPGASELLPKIKACLQRIVRLASTTKRTCQRAIGQYIERLLIQGIDETDRFLLDKLCPRVYDRSVASDNNGDGEADEELDEHDDKIDTKNEPLQFLSTLLLSIYTSKLPANKGSGCHVRRFIEKAKDFLPGIMEGGTRMMYPGSSFLRSTAVHLSVELRKHYKNGSRDLCEKV